jgi:hypothetical protein
MKAESRITEELRLIPRWSIIGGLLAFALVQYYFWVFLPSVRTRPPELPTALRFYLILSWGALAALYVLMIGYISNDAPRRGMDTRVWMICVIMPGGIGAVLYFLLRQPILTHCPSCGASIEDHFHFCPHCAYQVAASCGRCFAGTRVTDVYCSRCGHDLAADHLPARLHAFRRE